MCVFMSNIVLLKLSNSHSTNFVLSLFIQSDLKKSVCCPTQLSCVITVWPVAALSQSSHLLPRVHATSLQTCNSLAANLWFPARGLRTVKTTETYWGEHTFNPILLFITVNQCLLWSWRSCTATVYSQQIKEHWKMFS